MAALGALAGGCGRSARSGHSDPDSKGVGGSSQSGAGDSGAADSGDDHGGNQQAGSPDAGGGMSGTAGAPACIPGAPCSCEEQLVGTTDCTAEGPSCSCPPIEECTPATTTCFEPCGGDPAGNWVLEGGCFSGRALADCDGGSLEGSLASLDMRLSFLDGGQDASGELRGDGLESWNLVANVPLSCLGGAASCEEGQLFTGPTGPLHHSKSRAWLPTCRQNACGSCECSGASAELVPPNSFWSIAEGRLTLGSTPMSYCVKDDVLWLGDATNAGKTKVSYKLRRQSCVGTPIACEERTEEAECRAEQACYWNGQACSGSAPSKCDFPSCGQVRGCTLAAPVAPRCAGEAACPDFAANGCQEPGCSLETCVSGNEDEVSCGFLLLSDMCASAPGCTVDGGFCQGTTRCSSQTSDEACEALQCYAGTYCTGTPQRSCAELSVENCHDLGNCYVDW